MTDRYRSEREPKTRRLRELVSEVFPEQQRVQWNQDDPVWQTDYADQENPRDYAAHDFYHEQWAIGFFSRLAQRAWDERSNDRRQRAESIEPVVEYSQPGGPTEAVNADHWNQI